MKIVLVIIGVAMVAGLVRMIRLRQRRAAMEAGQRLLVATESGDIEQMQALLARRVDINAVNAQGWTPLHVAAAGGDVAVVELLLQHRVDVNGRVARGNLTPRPSQKRT